MVKFLTFTLFFYCIVDVQSCSTQKSPECPEYKYQPHSPRKVLSDKPTILRIGQLSLAGTHQSLSKGLGPEIETQELTITEQLNCGVRVLDITVSPLFNIFRIHIGSVYANISFGNVLKEIDEFLKHNPDEFIFLIINEDSRIYRFDETKCENNCDAFDYYITNNEAGWRLVKHWTFNDFITLHRGKILLATNSYRFRNDVYHLNHHCLLLKHQVWTFDGKDRIKSTLEHKWNKYKELTGENEYDHFWCYVYDLSVEVDASLIRTVSKYGGYKHKGQCIEPLNYKFTKYYSNVRRVSLRIVLFDYITQEAIDRVNSATIQYA